MGYIYSEHTLNFPSEDLIWCHKDPMCSLPVANGLLPSMTMVTFVPNCHWQESKLKSQCELLAHSPVSSLSTNPRLARCVVALPLKSEPTIETATCLQKRERGERERGREREIEGEGDRGRGR